MLSEATIYKLRTIAAYAIVPFMKVTGCRFNKSHRQDETLVYKCINTVVANIKADGY